ncbi:MAG: FprA family A-type flavoprotein [Thermoproteota archaeon]
MYYPLYRAIGRGVYWLSIPDVKSRLFESIWPIPEGVNYNAYLISEGDEYILIDSSKNIISAEELISLVRNITNPSNIRNIAVLHAEPDHSGLISDALSRTGNPIIHATSRASAFMKSMFNVETRTVKDGDSIKIGERVLKVIELPWIHWPDTMLLYLEDEKILFSSDAFGAFGALPKPLFDDEVDFDEYLRNAKEYFATVVSAYRRMVIRAFEKIGKLNIDISVIAPSHGVVVRNRVKDVLEKWISWCRLEKRRKVTIIYGSMYGLTGVLAEFARNTLEKTLEVVMHNAAVDKVNQVLSDIIDSAGVLIINPTYEGGVFPPISNILELMKIKKMGEGVLATVTVTKLWEGTAGEQLTSKLREAGCELLEPVKEYVNLPSKRELEEYEEFLSGFVHRIIERTP